MVPLQPSGLFFWRAVPRRLPSAQRPHRAESASRQVIMRDGCLCAAGFCACRVPAGCLGTAPRPPSRPCTRRLLCAAGFRAPCPAGCLGAAGLRESARRRLARGGAAAERLHLRAAAEPALSAVGGRGGCLCGSACRVPAGCVSGRASGLVGVAASGGMAGQAGCPAPLRINRITHEHVGVFAPVARLTPYRLRSVLKCGCAHARVSAPWIFPPEASRSIIHRLPDESRLTLGGG